MINIKVCAVMSVLCATTAFAEDDRLDLARQIEHTSKTTDQALPENTKGAGWVLYPPLNANIREMDVDGCYITARTVPIGFDDPISEITFDLTRTQIPDPTVPIGSEYAFRPANDENQSGTASITLWFLPPYKPSMYSVKFIGEGKIEQPVTFLRFLMQPVSDEEQPRRLLALLNQYQSAYCTYTG